MSKYSEKTLRRKAKNIGYRIEKGLQHITCAEGCPVHWSRTVGYMVMDETTGIYVWGSYDNVFDHQLDLDTIEICLKREYDKLGLDF